MIQINPNIYIVVLHDDIIGFDEDKIGAEEILQRRISEGFPEGIEDAKVMPLEDWFESDKVHERVDEFLSNISGLLNSIDSLEITKKYYVHILLNGDDGHVHRLCNNIMKKVFNMEEVSFKMIADTGSDWYQAYHTYRPIK